MLRLNLPGGLSFRDADGLAHQIVAEIAERHKGAATWGSLGREFDRSAFALLSRKPGTTISGKAWRVRAHKGKAAGSFAPRGFSLVR
ncbi:hypothetical protein J2S68_004393 [Glycomyces algeriensis]|uniref:Uncharacterized protein n=1 Tax=Glycomyces algeriensis TaxID=256037 RepID=A0A9W6G4T9_9ACTN|nr:hypothetical protein [Glycomyces algeriensis]MDR7352850.1 hypothetical protein [Glycomyces algeriensis]GLI40536.1 hypothetical protein GALLR39Z86_03860 [Glycomyces algeriensis]